MPGKVAAFAQLDIKLKNDRTSWSGRNEDKHIVAIVLWHDEIIEEKSKLYYDCYGRKKLLEGGKRAGNTMRISDIEWAIDNCDRHFHVIIGKFEQEEDKKK